MSVKTPLGDLILLGDKVWLFSESDDGTSGRSFSPEKAEQIGHAFIAAARCAMKPVSIAEAYARAYRPLPTEAAA